MRDAPQQGRGGETLPGWMLGSREEALKLAPAWGAGTGERGQGRGRERGRRVKRMRVGDLWRRRNAGRQRGAERVVTAHIY